MRRTPLSMLGGAIGPQTPSPLSAYPPGAMRSLTLEGSASFPGAREIRPKPTTSTGAYSQPSPIEQPLNKKKRGRPRKDDTQARSEMVAAPGEVNIPPGPQPAGASMMVLQAQPSPFTEPPLLEQPSAEELRPLPPVSRMPISSILTPTIQQSTSQSSSSSGKRKRGRSTRSEPEDYPAAGPSGAGQAQTYESPYSRLTIETQDSPARAAVLRHREEHDARPPSRDPQQRSAQAPTTVTAGPDPETT